MAVSSWRVPRKEAEESDKLGWLNDVIQGGRSYLKTQRAYFDLDRSLDQIAGAPKEKLHSSLSKVWVNRPKREITEVIATLSNLRPSWSYQTDNNRWHDQATKLTKLKDFWWYATFADCRIAEVLSWAAVQGTGYAMPYWERNFHARGRGDIDIASCAPEQVLPVQITSDGDLQRAYAVTIQTEVPIHLAHAQYPAYADRIKPDRDQPGWLTESLRKVKKYASLALNLAGPRGGDSEQVIYPTCDKYETYILDPSINDTGHRIPMGKPGTSWYYEVPYLGEELQTGIFSQGRELKRRAEPDDCKLYPLRRLMISFSSCIVEDDTSPWWHGMVPLVPFKLDDWPWEFLGFSLLRDITSINESTNKIRRAVEDSVNCRLSPPLRSTSDTEVAKGDLEKFDPRIPRQIIQFNTMLSGEEPLKPILPYQHYEVPAAAFQYIKDNEQEEGYLIGVQDFTNLAKARQIPSGDAQEKLMQMIGPLMEMRTRKMERSVSYLGQMWMPLAFQFYNTTRRVQILGTDATVEEDIDWDPGNMVPSHMPDEDPGEPSRYSKLDRLKWHIGNFHCKVIPYSITGLASMQRKLLEVQTSKIPGMPFDPWTFGQRMDIDMGPVLPDPETGQIPQTRVERFIVWQKLLAGLEVMKMAEMQKVAKEEGVEIPAPQQKGKGAGGGRPPSFQQPPQQQSKDGGSRSTIATSR